MDTTQYGESKYLTPQLIKESQQNSPQKIGLIISDAEVEDGKYGKQLVIRVSFDKKVKIWKLSKENVKSLHKISVLSENWLTKKIGFTVSKTDEGKDKIIGEPIFD